MNDIYLKFPSQESAEEVLNSVQYDPERYSTDVIGVIYKTTEIVDEEPRVVAIDGYHVNVRVIQGDTPEEFIPFIITTPNNPVRVWA